MIDAETVGRPGMPFAQVQSLRRVVEPARHAAYTDQALATPAVHVCTAGSGCRIALRVSPVAWKRQVSGAGRLTRDAMARYIKRLAE